MAGQHPAQGRWLRRDEVGGGEGEEEYGVEPTTLAAEGWAARPGGEGAAELLTMARNSGTAKKYARVLDKWFLFCETGYLGRAYDPLKFSLAKWWLFAGYMLDPEVNRDKDLNMVRSALNRFMEDNGRGRPALGLTVRTVIDKFKIKMEDLKRSRGEAVGLNRQPCPEEAFLALLLLGRLVTGRDLRRVASQLLQLVGWFRSDSLAGFQPGDVYFTPDGWLNILVRFVKMQPERRENPAHLRIPLGRSAGSTSTKHTRDQVFDLFRRADELVPQWYCYVADSVRGKKRSGSVAAELMTSDLRDLVGARVVIPAGVTMSSHSWREMAAVSSSRAGWCLFKMMRRGLWKRVETMIANYIDPFDYFPFSPVLAELYDDLAPGAVYVAGVHVRSDGHR